MLSPNVAFMLFTVYYLALNLTFVQSADLSTLKFYAWSCQRAKLIAIWIQHAENTLVVKLWSNRDNQWFLTVNSDFFLMQVIFNSSTRKLHMKNLKLLFHFFFMQYHHSHIWLISYNHMHIITIICILCLWLNSLFWYQKLLPKIISVL